MVIHYILYANYTRSTIVDLCFLIDISLTNIEITDCITPWF